MMPILKFKSHVTFAFFAAVNHLSRPLTKQKFTSTGSKGHESLVICGFQSILCVSLFQGSLLVIVILIDGLTKNAFFKAAFELLSAHVFEKRSENAEFSFFTFKCLLKQ